MVTICTATYNTLKFYVLPTQCIDVFCVDLRTFSCAALTDWFLYNRQGVCLLRGTDWTLSCNSGSFTAVSFPGFPFSFKQMLTWYRIASACFLHSPSELNLSLDRQCTYNAFWGCVCSLSFPKCQALEPHFFKCSRRILGKHSSIGFHENPSSGSRVVPCGRTDRRDGASSRFLQFCGSA